MKTSLLVTALAVAAAAAPASLQARDVPDGPAGGAAAAPGGFDLGSLLQGIDFSKIGDLLQGVDMSKIGELMQGVDMSKIGDLMKGFDMSKIGDLMKGVDISKLGALASPDIMKTYGSFLDKMMTVQKANKVEQMQPIRRSTATRIKMIYGPYRIKGSDTKEKVGNGFSLDPSGTGYMYAVGDDFPRDITIIDVKSGVYDDKYVPIDIGKGLYNHHNIFYDQSKPVTSITGCSSGKAAFAVPMSIFMGGATESGAAAYTSMDGKFNSGYYLGKDAPVVNMIDIVNYGQEDKTVYSVSELEYVTGKVDKVLPAYAQIIDIGMCDGGNTGLFIHAPAGKKQWTINTTDINITQNGYLINGKAHLHDGAVNMEIFLNGDQVCNSEAVYGGAGREGKQVDGKEWTGISDTTRCDKIIPIKKGDKIKFIANFDIAAHPEREQAKTADSHADSHAGAEKGAMPGMPGMGMMGGAGSGEAEGMALFTASFALDAPGTDPKYTIS